MVVLCGLFQSACFPVLAAVITEGNNIEPVPQAWARFSCFELGTRVSHFLTLM